VRSLRLGFTGDVCLGGQVRDLIARHGPQFPFTGAAPALRAVDLLIGNLECCLIRDTTGPDARRFMAVPAAYADGLKEAGFHAMSLANNHMMDCGADGLSTTLARLGHLGIRAFGAGPDLVHAEEPLMLERGGRRFAFLAASGFADTNAAKRRSGTAPLDRTRLGERVRAARKLADLVVVALHADLEFSRYPSPWRVRLSRWLVDQGADIVVQHHPHVCQGVELYRDGLIAYSLGNFVLQVRGNSYLETHAGTTDSILWTVDVDFTRSRPLLTWDWQPMDIDADHRPQPCLPERAAVRRQDLALRSKGLGDSALVRAQWAKRCGVEARASVAHLYYSARRGQWDRVWRTIRRMVRNPEERRWIRGLLTHGYV
jgi:poly-gamma-glutamate capsule biosynthesis protein CapA/YwtB (metallophosphatase superfamily)